MMSDWFTIPDNVSSLLLARAVAGGLGLRNLRGVVTMVMAPRFCFSICVAHDKR